MKFLSFCISFACVLNCTILVNRSLAEEMLLPSEFLTEVSLKSWNSESQTFTWSLPAEERSLSPLDTETFLCWGKPRPFTRGQACLVLNSGSIFVGTLGIFHDEKVVLSTEFLGVLEFPYENVAGILLPSVVGVAPCDRLLWELETRNFPQDTLILRDGSRLEGMFEIIEENRAIFDTDEASPWREKRWTPQLSEVFALAFSSRLRASVEKQTAGTRYFRLGLADGSLFSMNLSDPEWAEKMNQIPIEGISYIESPPQSMKYINPELTAATEAAKQVRWLDAVPPSHFEYASVLGKSGFSWNYGRNRSATGAPLQTNGNLYPHGLGVLPGMSLKWKLDGNFRKLVVFPAIDDGNLPGTSAVFRILTDGKPRAEIEVHRGETPSCCWIDVSEVKEIQLVTVSSPDSSAMQPPVRGSWLRGVLIP